MYNIYTESVGHGHGNEGKGEGEMVARVVGTKEAREHFRDLLDGAIKGQDFIIERYAKGVAVLIPFEDYEAIQEELEDIRAARRAAEAYGEWKRDTSVARPYAEIRKELVADRLLEE